MKVKRIGADIHAPDFAARRFHQEGLGLDPVMDMGWIATYAAPGTVPIQIRIATESGGGTSLPNISIDVDDVEAALACTRRLGFAIESGPVDEPWGVRRFYVRDPFGTLVDILMHVPSAA